MDSAMGNMEIDCEQAKQEFIRLFNQFILPRPGADKLLEWLNKSDFFMAPASSRFHMCVPGGLVIHSLNVYHRLLNLVEHTDVFLIFDFEPQHDSPHFATIRRMLEFFCESTAQGKLFINYPMMQSYKHFAMLPDPSFQFRRATAAEWSHYKEIVGSVSAYTNAKKYTYPIFMSLAAHHLKKANYILTGKYSIPLLEEYCAWNLTDIFDKQLECKEQDSFVHVLNTCIFVLVDYKPTSFFAQLRDRGNQFFIE